MDYIINIIKKIDYEVENIKGIVPEVLVLCIYSVIHFVVGYYHEPWLDESIAWQIARCASYKDILLKVPHYEGHPPLWHLVLSVFAKTGMPYEISLLIVTYAFMLATIVIIMRKAPFKRLVKLLIPFTYFFTYQYSIISRPYCMMALAFVIIAVMYKDRDKSPFKYIAALFFLCLTSAYGIMIAGGLALIWVFEICNKRKIMDILKSVVSDKRVWALFLLLCLAILLLLMIIPYKDTLSSFSDPTVKRSFMTVAKEYLFRFVYMFMDSIPDATIVSVTLRDAANISEEPYYNSVLFICAFLGIIIHAMIYIIGRKKHTLAVFYVPFVLFAGFGMLVYFSVHHIGIIVFLLILFAWVSKESKYNDSVKLIDTIPVKERETLIKLGKVIIIMMFVASVYWSVAASVQDVRYTYAAGREIADFIKENNLEDKNIMAKWMVYHNAKGDIIGVDTNLFAYADEIAPYFEHNIIFNFMNKRDDLNYSQHRMASESENEKNIEAWKKVGTPDVLIAEPELSYIYDDISYADYWLVFYDETKAIWKGKNEIEMVQVFVKKELAESLGLKKSEVMPMINFQ